MQARRIITTDHPYRPLFVEPRHDRCTEVGAHMFVIGRRRCLCGEQEAFAPTRQRSISQVSTDGIGAP